LTFPALSKSHIQTPWALSCFRKIEFYILFWWFNRGYIQNEFNNFICRKTKRFIT